MNTPVSFEIAKLLKEKGFDVKDRIKYEMYGSQVIPQLEPYNDTKWNIYKDYHLAPTIAEVVMWLYEKYGIWVSAVPYNDEELSQTLWENKIIHISDDYNDCSDYTFYHSPTEAYEAGIEYTLNNLI